MFEKLKEKVEAIKNLYKFFPYPMINLSTAFGVESINLINQFIFQSKETYSYFEDHSGSLFPVIFGTCIFNFIDYAFDGKVLKNSYNLIHPSFFTIVSIAGELPKYIREGEVDDKDIYAALLGGLIGLGITKFSEFLQNRANRKSLEKTLI